MSQQKLPIVYITRKECFSAAHTLKNDKLTAEQNKQIFSKCNNCHGHNYIVEVTVKGRVDPITGMVINITVLKKLIQEIIDELDHKNLDVDVDFFKTTVSTTENLTVYFWTQLNEKLTKAAAQCELHEIKIFETDKNICIYRGEDL